MPSQRMSQGTVRTSTHGLAERHAFCILYQQMRPFRRSQLLAISCLLLSLLGTTAALALDTKALPDAPSTTRTSESAERMSFDPNTSSSSLPVEPQSRKNPQWDGTEREPFHWKGLILQSLSFEMLQNGTRVITASQKDRRLLLNKPYWSDYWASLQQFNWRRWNDGDSFPVNYIGHPMEGAIAGYLEVQNNPRDRSVQMGNNRAYWMSRARAAAWAAVYSTQWELGPLGESAIFNQGGFTYPIRCEKNQCNANSQYTNNTGWVDLIITPTVGTLWMLGEDALDRFVTDPLVRRHPGAFGYKVLRSGANPSRSLANMLRGRYPWYRDYEHLDSYHSAAIGKFEEAMDKVPTERFDLFPHFTAYSLRTNRDGCTGCRVTVRGGGIGGGYQMRKYLDLIVDYSTLPDASPESSLNIGGDLTMMSFGLRSGYNGNRFALKAALAPGFASYSRAQSTSNGPYHRATNFTCTAMLSGEVKFTKHLGARVTVQNMLIRYKSPIRDPDGIGTPPRLYFMSHDNYINSTNWGVKVGPVLRF